MTTGITAREIMDAAMTLEEGEKSVTQCDSFQAMEALRSNLYKARKALLKTHRTLAYSLWISRETKDGNYFVNVSKEMSVSGTVIVSKDGEVRPFERIEPAVIGDETEAERMLRLMQQDGMTEEEIADALAEKGEDDFDKAASAIEEAQGVAVESDSEKEGGETK